MPGTQSDRCANGTGADRRSVVLAAARRRRRLLNVVFELVRSGSATPARVRRRRVRCVVAAIGGVRLVIVVRRRISGCGRSGSGVRVAYMTVLALLEVLRRVRLLLLQIVGLLLWRLLLLMMIAVGIVVRLLIVIRLMRMLRMVIVVVHVVARFFAGHGRHRHRVGGRSGRGGVTGSLAIVHAIIFCGRKRNANVCCYRVGWRCKKPLQKHTIVRDR